MKNITVILLALFSLGMASRVEWMRNKEIIVNKSVVQINDICSGFIVEPDIVLTASHCIRGAKEQLVEFYNHDRVKFKLFYNSGQIGNEFDYAILQGDIKGLPGLELTPRWPKHGEFIYHMGHSRGQKAQFFTPGIYDRVECTKNGCEHYVIAHIVPGDSGGALITQKDNKVFSIVHSSYWPSNIPYGIGTPIIHVINKLKELKKKRTLKRKLRAVD